MLRTQKCRLGIVIERVGAEHCFKAEQMKLEIYGVRT